MEIMNLQQKISNICKADNINQNNLNKKIITKKQYDQNKEKIHNAYIQMNEC